ncbi:P-loop containing nucleoside triphosphate hydrolase protein, partial [Lyophyllum atratum]
PATTQPHIPADLSSLLAFLASFSALHDWLKLIVIGGVLETCRRLFYTVYDKVVNAFFITATFEDGDDSYDWMMVWLSKKPSWAEARELQISTKSFGLNSSAVLIPGEDEDASSLMKGSRKLAYLPRMSTTHSIWYKRRWISVTRSQEATGYYNRPEEKLTIRIMTRHHHFLNDLLLEAKKEYLTAQEHTISIYVSDSSNDWRHVATRPKRPLHSIILDPGIKDLLIDDARDFLASKPWYAARGIPFRRGYLLYGAPGSGKTSIIHSLAGELGLDVYIISLSRMGMDDTALNELTSELPEKCIALMEDIDAAFTQTLNRDDQSSESGSDEHDSSSPREPQKSNHRVSLSGLLNALDGVGAQEGRILFATTNKYHSLDPALCRPGRMDIHIEFNLASQFQARELYHCFYLPVGEGAEPEDDAASEKDSVDSGYSLAESSNLVDLETSSEDCQSSTSTPSSPPCEKVPLRGYSHLERAPKLSRSQISHLANRFANAIPERKFSMASLQGYLMGYKTRPFDAVKDISAWVEKECLPKVSLNGA